MKTTLVILTWASLAGVVAFAPTAHSQSAFSQGFAMGSQAASSAAANARAEALLRQQREQLRLRYGTPALDRIDALEQTADRWAEEAWKALEHARAGLPSTSRRE